MTDWNRSETEWNERVSPVMAVVNTVAAVTGRDPLDMPPLYEYVETDALDALARSGATDANEAVAIRFLYEDHSVLVESTGNIEVTLDTAHPE